MSTHTIAKYRDGYVWVEYCKHCGAEGLELTENCPGDKTGFKNNDKKIDNKSELK